MVHLSDSTLRACGRRAGVPTQDRSRLRHSVVHIGVGGFHRAHQAVYLDSLLRTGETGWGEIGVGLHSPAMKQALAPQDCLFTVVERDATGDSIRIVGSICGYLFAPDDPEAVLRALASPRTRVVSLTVTGGGYNLDAHGRFRADAADVSHDVRSPAQPRTWFGYLVAALERRHTAGLPGFTVLSCDNVADNGRAARTAVLSFARLRDDRLADWIDRNVTFPESLVDRITPQTNDALRTLVKKRWGIKDRWPVATERYSEWVVEDEFCNGRPDLERVGGRFVSDVSPYKLVKTRMLNGAHTAMAYLGQLAGYRTPAEVMANSTFAAFLELMLTDEIQPCLPLVPSLDLATYRASVLERLANPRVGDTIERLCERGSTKVPGYLLPSLAAARRSGHPAPLLTLAVAGWFRFLRGRDAAGRSFDVVDPRRESLQRLAWLGGTDPGPLLAERGVMGDLGDDGLTRQGLEQALRRLDRGGPLAAVRREVERAGVGVRLEVATPVEARIGA